VQDRRWAGLPGKARRQARDSFERRCFPATLSGRSLRAALARCFAGRIGGRRLREAEACADAALATPSPAEACPAAARKRFPAARPEVRPPPRQAVTPSPRRLPLFRAPPRSDLGGISACSCNNAPHRASTRITNTFASAMGRVKTALPHSLWSQAAVETLRPSPHTGTAGQLAGGWRRLRDKVRSHCLMRVISIIDP
jgi:hypothetical protein